MNTVDDEKADILRRLAEANPALHLRAHREGLDIEYSADDDFLHITIGQPRPSEAVSTNEQFPYVLLFDPESYEITAIEAPFFLESLRRHGHEVDFWSFLADLIERSGPRIFIPPAADGERAEQGLSRLLVR